MNFSHHNSPQKGPGAVAAARTHDRPEPPTGFEWVAPTIWLRAGLIIYACKVRRFRLNRRHRAVVSSENELKTVTEKSLIQYSKSKSTPNVGFRGPFGVFYEWPSLYV